MGHHEDRGGSQAFGQGFLLAVDWGYAFDDIVFTGASRRRLLTADFGNYIEAAGIPSVQSRFRIIRSGSPHLAKISNYFKPTKFISILDLLADVEKVAPFLHHLGHQSKTHERKRPTSETFFASIIAMGCNIGVEKMKNIAKGIQVSTLQNTSDWYLSLQALQDANDTLI